MKTFKQQMVRYVRICSIFIIIMFFWTASIQAKNVTDWIEDQDLDLDQEQEDIQKEPVQEYSTEKQESSFVWSLLKLVGILALLIGLLYVGIRIFTKRNRQMRDLNVLENLGGIPVGQQKSVQLVRVGSSFYLLGVGENVELLQEITDESLIQELEELTERPDEESLLSVFRHQKKTKEEQHAPSSFKDMYTKELDHLMNQRKDMIQSRQKKEEENE